MERDESGAGLKPGWLARALESAKRDTDAWPKEMRERWEAMTDREFPICKENSKMLDELLDMFDEFGEDDDDGFHRRRKHWEEDRKRRKQALRQLKRRSQDISRRADETAKLAEEKARAMANPYRSKNLNHIYRTMKSELATVSPSVDSVKVTSTPNARVETTIEVTSPTSEEPSKVLEAAAEMMKEKVPVPPAPRVPKLLLSVDDLEKLAALLRSSLEISDVFFPNVKKDDRKILLETVEKIIEQSRDS
jgi:hypothetical protein